MRFAPASTPRPARRQASSRAAYPRGMGQPLPIACTLSAGDLASRVAGLRALGGDGLLSVTEARGRAELRFAPRPDIRRRVEAAAAAEAECCAFLDFRVANESDATLLTISAPNGGADAIQGLVPAFAGGESR